MTLNLSNIISPAFKEPHTLIQNGTCNQLILKGGRGSTKSSFASIEGILLLLQNPRIHAVVMRKVANTMKNTVFAQYEWAILQMGLYSQFEFTKQPMEITYKPTGQKILFFGADDPGKIKSLKVPFGYVGFLHLEELDQFAGEEEVRNIEQSVLRGGPLSFEIKTFNPPISKTNWANRYCMYPKPNQFIHTSTYLTTPPEWLGERFLADADYLKQINPKAYEHEYMGIPVGSGGMVFENVKMQTITESEILAFEPIYNGVDFGWYPDPWAYNRCHYNAAKRILYLFAEEQCYKTSNQETAEMIKKHLIFSDELITCDIDNKSVGDYRSYGLTARAAIKGPGSVGYSTKWLQSLNAIVIDPTRCPNTFKEFTEYEYEKDKNGEVISGYPDKNNHHIDAVRYALERVWQKNGQ